LQEEIHSIEMIISDVVMPKMGGLELKLIAGQMRPGIPFLLISGFADKVEPGHPFLQKPFRLESLAVKIRQMLEY
jgi:DNA-binding NtrC family response regulator